ncbi:hypothetical protein PHMEG_00011909 [Phytophthora megakarya]|uniref:Uncharacterized protein n=1 Tax=Phytophthora megakarya TaxID=4795 RepID=A0A225WBS3_9STRA|nr:hypothetical protein PHMEG_00011909 [Phytophthora megakarya]
MYVEMLDFHREQDASFVCDSYRKLKWVRERQHHRIAALQQEQENKAELDENVQDSVPIVESAPVAAETYDENTEDVLSGSPVDEADNPFNILVGDVLRGYNLSVACRGVLPVLGSDPLEVISIPCIRDGNSLTLCSVPGVGDFLVVFGGRVFRDTSMLVPRGVRQDPMLFERTRYTYSNSVYVFDLATNMWTRNECYGREPRERSDHSALFMAPQNLLIYGGRGRNGQVLRDFFALSLELWHWTQIDTSATPYERYWHGWCIAFDTERSWRQEPIIFLFGGKSDTLVYKDLYQLQTKHLKLLLADEEDHMRNDIRGGNEEPTVQREGRRVSVATQLLIKDRGQSRLPAWFLPDTVGKPPSARFGMQLVALEYEQLAVIGGWRTSKNKFNNTMKNRSLDVHILDLTTLVWSTPKLSTLVSAQPYVPSERLLFECFYSNKTLVLFGGHTYASNGETESFSACEDASTALYKLDVSRMIWRRQKFPVTSDKAVESQAVVPLPLAHLHSSNNAVFNGQAFTCSSEINSLQLQLTAFDIGAPRS